VSTPLSRLTLEWQRPDGGLERIYFDASEREVYEETATATEHAVESGQAITDHVRPNPRALSFEAWVTNTPIVTPATHADGATGEVRGVSVRLSDGRTVTISALQWSNPFDRVTAVDELLLTLIRAGQLMKVYSGLRVTENVVLERRRTERTVEHGSNAVPITLEFKQIRLATTQRVPAPRRTRRRERRGPQPTQPALRSLGANLLNSAIGAEVF
jgi:hypothetical protein